MWLAKIGILNVSGTTQYVLVHIISRNMLLIYSSHISLYLNKKKGKKEMYLHVYVKRKAILD